MMNVNELEGAELDAAVARAAGLFIYGMERMRASEGGVMFVTLIGDGSSPNLLGQPEIWTPSRSWAHGGPIIERERINLRFDIPPDLYNEYGDQPPYPIAWFARSRGIDVKGPTPLIAAMRAFVAGKKT